MSEQEIQRYTIRCGLSGYGIQPTPFGDYCRFADLSAVVAERDARIEEKVQEFRELGEMMIRTRDDVDSHGGDPVARCGAGQGYLGAAESLGSLLPERGSEGEPGRPDHGRKGKPGSVTETDDGVREGSTQLSGEKVVSDPVETSEVVSDEATAEPSGVADASSQTPGCDGKCAKDECVCEWVHWDVVEELGEWAERNLDRRGAELLRARVRQIGDESRLPANEPSRSKS